MYNEKVMQAFQNPQNVGEIEDYDGIGTVGNAVCGDIMQITIKVKDGRIADAKFKTTVFFPLYSIAASKVRFLETLISAAF